MLGHRQLEPSEYFEILKRRRALIIICAVVCLVASVSFCKTLPPRYLSQTLVLIERQKVPDEYVRPVIESNLDSRLASMKEQILSRSRIQPIIERYNLYGTATSNMDERVDEARKAIGINPIHSTIANAGGLPGFFITFTYSDAHTAQLVCGEITTLFTNENLRSREAVTEGTNDFLKGQLTEAKAKLDDMEEKMATFQRDHFGKLPDDTGSNIGMMTSLNAQLDAVTQSIARAEQDRSILDSMLLQQQQSVAERLAANSGVNPTTGAVAKDPTVVAKEAELKSLRDRETVMLTQYTPSYPDVVAIRRQIEDVKRELATAQASASSAPGTTERRPTVAVNTDTPAIQQLRAQLRAADVGIQEKKREQAQIQSHLATYEERIQATPQVEADYKELTRDYNSANAFYQDLLGKINRSKLAGDLEKRQEGEQFRVMDEPNLPDSPSFPKVPVFAAGGLFFGLFIGLSIAAFQEYKDTTLRSEKDVWAFTRLPTLGVISVAGSMPDIEDPVAGRIGRMRSGLWGPFRWCLNLLGRIFSKLKRKRKPTKPNNPNNTLADNHV